MEKIKVFFNGNSIETNSSLAFSLLEKSFFGEKIKNKVVYSIYEVYYLFEQNKIEVYNKDKKLSEKDIIKKLNKIDKNFDSKYLVFSDLRDKGLIVKTALKFGTDFRVYDKAKKPGKDHAKWLLSVFNENQNLSWQDFAAKNRIAHSTNKKLLIAVVDSEQKISYYDSSWLKI